MNPSHVPQARSTESFWVCLGSKVYEGGWEVKKSYQLESYIKIEK